MAQHDAGVPASSDSELRDRYRIEREKRLRKDGMDQYLELDVVFKDIDADPYAEPGFTRESINEEVEVVIIGAGFGGMLAAANLCKEGVNSFRMIDKAADFGGTWYWNRYPGAACDVESYSYLPMLEETGYIPTEKYTKAPEIFAYCQLLGRHFDLYRAALFQTEVEATIWDETRRRWTVTTTRGDQLSSRFLVIAGGVLHKAKLPGIKDIETFQGHSFHTSRWDYVYTGGGPLEFMEKLADKRVGIIGTGATAVQAIPKLGEAAKELVVFQRTPSSVGVRNNQATNPDWVASLKPGWQQERIDNFTALVIGDQPDVDLIQDGWGEMLYVDTRGAADSPEQEAALEHIDFENMERVRQRVAAIVEDPKTAESLKPYYNQLCKRLCFHDDYLPTFNRSNVTLVDTDGKGVERITPNGVVANGVEYPVDCLIYASGFEVMTDYTHRLGFDPHGRAGIALSEAWNDGPSTLFGVHTRGFPNLLMISTVQGGQAINFLHTITATALHVAKLIAQCESESIDTIEPTVAAEQEWFNIILTNLMKLGRYNETCTPGYLNNEGGGDMRSARAGAYMGRPFEYIERLEQWRADGSFEGLEVTHDA